MNNYVVYTWGVIDTGDTSELGRGYVYVCVCVCVCVCVLCV